MKPWVLRSIMKKAGLKMKKIRIVNAPLRRTVRLEEFDEKILTLDDKVNEILLGGKHLVFCDESIFRARSF